jgi:bifunctional non-homologous end joining protein LigD
VEFEMAGNRKKNVAIGNKAPFPDFIEPALATTVDNAPSGSRWMHEIKFDGYRVQVHIKDGKVKVYTRAGATTGAPAPASSQQMPLRSTPDRPSSMVRSLCRDRTVSLISPFCRMS